MGCYRTRNDSIETIRLAPPPAEEPMSTVAARPATAPAWRNAIFVVFTLNGFGAAAWISRIPSVRDHLAISVTEVGSSSSASRSGRSWGSSRRAT
jgi:hypothetical protein